MYVINTGYGQPIQAATIAQTLDQLAERLMHQLPHGPVTWNITDADGLQHRGHIGFNDQPELLIAAIGGLVDELYTQLTEPPTGTTSRHRYDP